MVARGCQVGSIDLRSSENWTTTSWKRATAPFLRGNALLADWKFAVKVEAKRWHLRLPW